MKSNTLNSPLVGRGKRRGFTMIELLVVVSIIALLLTILLPAINKARSKARSGVCKTNMRQIAMALFLYNADNNAGVLSSFFPAGPGSAGWDFGPITGGWLAPYYKNQRVAHCPEVTQTDNAGTAIDDITQTINYSAAAITTTGNVRADQIPSGSDTVMIGDVGKINSDLTISNIPSGSDLINAPVSVTNFAGALGVVYFMGRHNGLGNVGWYDGHVSEESPWMSTTYLAALSTVTPAVKGAFVKAKLGYLTPLPTTIPVANFNISKTKAYYFYGDKSQLQ